MKKAIALLIFMQTTIFVYAQEYKIDSLSKMLKYEIVFEQNGNKDELFKRANNWVSQNFKKSPAVIDLTDKENGQLFVKGYKEFLYSMELVINKKTTSTSIIGQLHF